MYKRYFTEETAKPGQISDELRVALGISKKSLPVWIHRMRILGYPPGWLKKADMTNTTINFIDGDADTVPGEIEDVEKTYNTDSFFEFPGFNAPVPKGVKDDYEKLGMPPMQQFQQLNYAKQTVQSIQPVPFRRNTTELKDKTDQSDSDSEASDDEKNETIELNSTVEQDEQEKEQSEDDSDDSEIIVLDVEKRSLCSKQSKKADLKHEPEDGKAIEKSEESKEADLESKEPADEESSKAKSSEDQAAEEKPADEKPADEKPADEKSADEKLVDENSTKKKPTGKKQIAQNGQQSETEDREKPEDRENAAADDSEDADCADVDTIKGRESTSSRITLVSLGAPVPAALNGEKPPLENFGVGMGPMIHFENLPNSTGVFNKMRKVIKKIRKKLS